MRVRRRFGRNASLILLPAICCAVSAYFGYAFIFGERGLLAWRQTQDDLQIAKHDLGELRAKREALAHRIALLDGKAIDPDLLEPHCLNTQISRSVQDACCGIRMTATYL